MKKSIVLIITLLFVSAISALVYQTLEDTNSYMKQQNYKLNKTQLLVSVKNVQEEISRVFLKNEDAVENIVENASVFIPLKVKDIDVLFKLKEYEKLDINLLSKKDEKDYKVLEDLFLDNDINDFDSFNFIFKNENKSIWNMAQRDDIIKKFINETLNSKIENIKNKIGFLSKTSEEVFYELFIRVNYLGQLAKAYYVLNKKGEVKYFELSFK